MSGNRHEPASGFEGLNFGGDGLTKLEYAAIHVLSGIHSDSNSGQSFITNESACKYAINAANELFDQLEKEGDK